MNLSGPYLKQARGRSIGIQVRREMREELGVFINKNRLIAGLSQEELSTACGYDYIIAQRWENADKPHVQPEDVGKLVAALHLPAGAFEPFMPIIVKRTYKKSNDPSVGRNIERRLSEVGILPSELARKLGLYPQHIDGYVKGTTEPRMMYIKKMVDILFPKHFQMEGTMYLLYGTPLPSVPHRIEANLLRERVKLLEGQLHS